MSVERPGGRQIEFRPPGRLLNANEISSGRIHWATKARMAAQWRAAARIAGLTTGRGPAARALPPCLVQCSFPVPDRRRRDPANYFPTTKPIIDGLVDAGLWPDDTPEWVEERSPRLVVGASHVVVDLTPMVS